MNKKVYIVSEECDSLYKGGISSIIESYFLNEFIFNSLGYSIYRINPLTFKVCGNFFIRKIKNIFRVKSEQKKVFHLVEHDKNDCIVHIHTGYGFILLKSLFICKYLKKNGVKHVILSIHFADFNKIFSRNPLFSIIEQKIAKKYPDKIILLSKHTRDEFVQHNFLENKLDVLYTFHSYGDSDLKVNYTKNLCEPICMLFVGSIDKRKGVLDLLHSLRLTNNKNIKVIICGSSNDRKTFRLFANEIDSLKNVSYVGYVSGKEKVDIFQQSDILILPSYSEGLPIVISEAMHFGCGIISTNVGSISEILKEKDNCLFFNPGDINYLVDILNNINHSEINQMKINNIELSNRFTCNNNIKKLCSIYKEFYE